LAFDRNEDGVIPELAQKKQVGIPCIFQEDAFQMAVPNSTGGVHRFTISGGMWSASYELAPLMNVKLGFPLGPQYAQAFLAGYLVGRLSLYCQERPKIQYVQYG
jgi:hypothetical protein